jgi:NifU-like protein involved in Fe-S cluster formation
MTVGSQVKSCFSSIKSAEATLELLANKTQHQQAKEAFEETRNLVTEVKDDLQKQVIQLGTEEPQYKG